VAEEAGGSGDAIFAELRANIVQHARMVPAGIIAVNRAQEQNYALCYTA
jgi:intracellular sulfur oxidation DsrE/DsrF family protein